MVPLILVLLTVIVVAIIAKVLPIKRVIVYEYQKALKYKKGRYAATLDPGQYWVSSLSTLVVPVDIRSEFITIQGQDVLSADGVTVKISLASEFQVIDPNLAVNKTANFRGNLYLVLQMALREIVGKEKIDALLENRAGISVKLMEMAKDKASDMGVKLISADVKDMMFAGEMKKAFAQVVKAQKEGQAALERARGETAALRSLANAARTMDDNPNLLQLRALQALADSSGNTLVFGLPNNALPLTKQAHKNVSPPAKSEE
ncbi:MAG TPA: slipin family protein [Candidatus Angelobacter sp.]|jgi:regulator of protease activity HflC (stomatin/prohibitin superfamily)